MADVNVLLSEFQKFSVKPESELDLIRRAFEFAQTAHRNQKRKSGEPYFSHCFETALKIAEWRLDAETIAASLLHDAIEDAGITFEKIKTAFGKEVAFLAEGATKLGRLKYRTAEEKQAENLRKMILALSEDVRVVLIKLADRLHNMKTLKFLPVQKQKRIALETSGIYAPLAHRLGMANLAGELEDLAFPYLHPQEYQWLNKNVADRYEERQKYLETVRDIAEKKLKENGVAALKIDSRAKRYSSLYKKLLRCDMNLEQIYDLVALRITVKTVEDCYAAMGLIHQIWPPLPGKIKDYIALPKPNSYRSIHTTVFCVDNKPTEFQIRTREMHDEAENGIAAYWAYNEAKSGKQYRQRKAIFAREKELEWVNQLKEWQRGISDSEEFLNSLKIDFFKDRVFAITPKGEVIDLPAGSTPVDFAYAVHTEIGNQCVGARVNSKIVPLEYQLQSGDLVEILVQKSKKPSESWLEFVKSEQAKKRIKNALNRSKTLNRRPTETEFRIIAEDRVGLLKDLSAVISRSHVNIVKADIPKTAHFPAIKIRCQLSDKEKTEKIVWKLKAVKGVKEISYKSV